MSLVDEQLVQHNSRFKYRAESAPAPRESLRERLDPRKVEKLKLGLGLALPLVGLLLMGASFQDPGGFQAPPDTISIRNLRIEAGSNEWMTGLVVNQSHRDTRKVVFQLSYRANGQEIVDYIVQNDLRSGEFRTFRILASGRTGQRTLITRDPVATPFHVDWPE